MIAAELTPMGSRLTEVEPGLFAGQATADVHYDPARSLHWRDAEESSAWHRHRAEVVTDVVTAFPPGGTLFDLGAGNGFVSRALVEAGIPAVPVEPVEEAVRTAYERGLRPVVWSTLEDAGFPPESLSAAGLFDVLEHLDDDIEQLRLLGDLLAPGGRLYVTVPKHPRLWSAHDTEAGHRRRYTSVSLRAVIEAAGFKVEYETSFFSALLAPMAIRRIVQRSSRRGGAVVADPTGGNGPAARVLGRLLAHERSSLRRRTRRTGTSLLVVARRD